MEVDLFKVDAFTARPFAGNPAAVCILEARRDEHWMQAVAREMNLPITAYLVPREGSFDLRWFSPAVEISLCGHGTLASAHVLWETGRLDPATPAKFQTQSGLLTARRRGEWIDLDLPARPQKPAEVPAGLAEALGTKPLYVGRNPRDFLVEVESEATLRSLNPDPARLRALPARGVIVTSRSSTPEYDFVSRYFAPGDGIDEDAVTGSAHCCLGPFWQERLRKDSFLAYQASPRGGVLQVAVQGERVRIGGQAVTIVRGKLLCP